MEDGLVENSDCKSISQLVILLYSLFPYPLSKSAYSRVICGAFNLSNENEIFTSIDAMSLKKILLFTNNCIEVKKYDRDKTINSFLRQTEGKAVIDRFYNSLVTEFTALNSKELLDGLLDISRSIVNRLPIKNKDSILRLFEKICKERKSNEYGSIITLFSNKSFDDSFKIDVIKILYSTYRFHDSTRVFRSLEKRPKSKTFLTMMASAFFLINETEMSCDLLRSASAVVDEEKSNRSVALIACIEKLEQKNGLDDHKNKARFKRLYFESIKDSEIAELSMRLSFSFFPKDELIRRIENGEYSVRTSKLYNNIGAIYLSMAESALGETRQLCLCKAKQYLQFADFLCTSLDEYSPYIKLNLCILNIAELKLNGYVFKLRGIKARIKELVSLDGLADSTYFSAIIKSNLLCLHAILGSSRLEGLIKEIETFSKGIDDEFVHRKILQFTSFATEFNQKKGHSFIPIWIITESHY